MNFLSRFSWARAIPKYCCGGSGPSQAVNRPNLWPSSLQIFQFSNPLFAVHFAHIITIMKFSREGLLKLLVYVAAGFIAYIAFHMKMEWFLSFPVSKTLWTNTFGQPNPPLDSRHGVHSYICNSWKYARHISVSSTEIPEKNSKVKCAGGRDAGYVERISSARTSIHIVSFHDQLKPRLHGKDIQAASWVEDPESVILMFNFYTSAGNWAFVESHIGGKTVTFWELALSLRWIKCVDRTFLANSKGCPIQKLWVEPGSEIQARR